MEAFYTISAFIVAVIISSIIYNRLPKVPLAFIQIIIGILMFITPIPIDLEFESELFLLGIIAPLLFLEGNHVSRIHLMKYLKPVLLMALGLVFTTVAVLGFILHYFVPDIPLAACFALAAIICPTDAVAVSAIAKGRKLPKGLMTILEGESLFNDAAGILSFKIAVAALATGVFSFPNAVMQFTLSTIGGLLIGFIIGLLFVNLRVRLIKSGFEDDHALIFIQIITPFIIYYVAEMVHVSGIIAAVTGGLLHGIERDRIAQGTTRLQFGYDNTWDLLSTALNGFVFTILGYLIPEVISNIVREEPEHLLTLSGIAVAVSALVYVFRFIWVYLLYDMFYIPDSRFIRMMNNEDLSKPPEKRPDRFKYAFIAALCGVHGTISMAIALTLPTELKNHQPFELRNDLLFVSAFVIIISLIAAQVILPFVTQNESEGETSRLSFKEARLYLLDKAMVFIRETSDPENSVAHANLLRQYNLSSAFLRSTEEGVENDKEIHRLQSKALDIELATLESMVEHGEVTESALNNYIQYTERTNIFKSASIFKKIYYIFRFRKNKIVFENYMNQSSSLSIRNSMMEMEKVAVKVHTNVLNMLKDEVTNKNRYEVAVVGDSYLNKVDRLKRITYDESIEDKEALLAIKVIHYERKCIHELIEKKKVSKDVAVELRQALNYDEMMLLNSYGD